MMDFYGDKAKQQQAANAAEAAKTIAEHVVAKEETLSEIALKHYGHATPPYWKLILEANEGVIGKSEKNVKPGMKLKIPALPAELAKKK